MPYHIQRNAANTLNADGTLKRNHPYREPGTTMNIRLSDEEKEHGRRCVKDFIKQWSLDCITPQVVVKQTKKREMKATQTPRRSTKVSGKNATHFLSVSVVGALRH